MNFIKTACIGMSGEQFLIHNKKVHTGGPHRRIAEKLVVGEFVNDVDNASYDHAARNTKCYDLVWSNIYREIDRIYDTVTRGYYNEFSNVVELWRKPTPEDMEVIEKSFPKTTTVVYCS